MDIGFVWDESKYQLTVKKHGVRLYEHDQGRRI